MSEIKGILSQISITDAGAHDFSPIGGSAIGGFPLQGDRAVADPTIFLGQKAQRDLAKIERDLKEISRLRAKQVSRELLDSLNDAKIDAREKGTESYPAGSMLPTLLPSRAPHPWTCTTAHCNKVPKDFQNPS